MSSRVSTIRWRSKDFVVQNWIGTEIYCHRGTERSFCQSYRYLSHCRGQEHISALYSEVLLIYSVPFVSFPLCEILHHPTRKTVPLKRMTPLFYLNF